MYNEIRLRVLSGYTEICCRAPEAGKNINTYLSIPSKFFYKCIEAFLNHKISSTMISRIIIRMQFEITSNCPYFCLLLKFKFFKEEEEQKEKRL